MHRLITLALALLSATAFAVTGSEVAYVGGSLAGAKAGDIGSFDTTQANELIFAESSRKWSIEYTKILKIEYHNDVARHLGVAPAIAVGLLKHREKKHFFTLTYVDSSGTNQAAVFEVSKEAPRSLLAVLGIRAPQACILGAQSSSCPINRPVKP